MKDWRKAVPEPPIGSKHTDADGTIWVKVRTLGQVGWTAALAEAHLTLKLAGIPGADGARLVQDVRNMGYAPAAELAQGKTG